MRRRSAAAALVEQHDVVACRIELAAVIGAAAGAGAAIVLATRARKPRLPLAG